MVVRPSDSGGVGFGITGDLGLPTGDRELYLGEGWLSGTAGVVGTVEAAKFTLSGQAALQLKPHNPPRQRPAPTRGGDNLRGAIALNWVPSEHVGIGVETHGSFALDPVVREAVGIPAEVLLSTRVVSDSGVFLTAGLGTAVGMGAGASPFRAVLGGGLRLPPGPPSDADGDGFIDTADLCPREPETLNGLTDEDGCPDELPTLQFVADVPGPAAETAEITVVRAPGVVVNGVGRVTVRGRPGQRVTVAARVGACRSGSAEIMVADDSQGVFPIPVRRVSAPVVVKVHDVAGRPVDGVTVRYITEDPLCGADDTRVVDGEGIHQVGTGPHTVFITAPGYDIHQEELMLEQGKPANIEATLSPTQVTVSDERVVFATPLLFTPGAAILQLESEPLVSQMATLMLTSDIRIRITGYADADGGGGRQLAWSRAEAIKTALEQRGVDRERLVTNGATGPAPGESFIDVRVLPKGR